jgi:iron complex outermembrane receptor protein
MVVTAALLRWFVLFALPVLTEVVAAQDTVNLPVVSIVGNRLDAFANEINTQKADSFVLARSAAVSLSEILTGYSNLNIKTYGYGGMASVSVRNGNSYQAAVLWNGFNLQDPLNGGVDISHIPGFFIDKLEVHRGGETSLFGSGAVGGVISIGSAPVFNRGLTADVLLSAGSFGSFGQGAGVGFSGKRLSSDIKVFHRYADNDFPYINTEKIDKPLEYQSNAQTEQLGIMQRNAFLISSNQLLKLDVWYQHNENHIPNSMSQTAGEGSLTDNESIRTSLGYLFTGKGYKIKARTAVFYKSLFYNDVNAGFDYRHRSFTSITEVTGEFRLFEKQLLMAGVNNTYDKGISESLSPDAMRNRTSLFLSYRHRFGLKTVVRLNARQEIAEGRFVPPTFSAKAAYSLTKAVTVYTSLSRNYRLPTFNDLFWSDYASRGNPGLKPEHGYSGELGFKVEKEMSGIGISLKVNGFYSRVSDRIHWIPVEGIWTPDNLEEVASSGLETFVEMKAKAGKNTFFITGGYTFLRSELTATDYPYAGDILGKQLMFTPLHKANLVFRWLFGDCFAEYKQGFTGRVYTTSDNSEWLDPFTVGNISAGYNFAVKKFPVSIGFGINNIFNTTYYLMPAYAMPGINYELTLNLKFRNNEK